MSAGVFAHRPAWGLQWQDALPWRTPNDAQYHHYDYEAPTMLAAEAASSMYQMPVPQAEDPVADWAIQRYVAAHGQMPDLSMYLQQQQQQQQQLGMHPQQHELPRDDMLQGHDMPMGDMHGQGFFPGYSEGPQQLPPLVPVADCPGGCEPQTARADPVSPAVPSPRAESPHSAPVHCRELPSSIDSPRSTHSAPQPGRRKHAEVAGTESALPAAVGESADASHGYQRQDPETRRDPSEPLPPPPPPSGSTDQQRLRAPTQQHRPEGSMARERSSGYDGLSDAQSVYCWSGDAGGDSPAPHFRESRLLPPTCYGQPGGQYMRGRRPPPDAPPPLWRSMGPYPQAGHAPLQGELADPTVPGAPPPPPPPTTYRPPEHAEQLYAAPPGPTGQEPPVEPPGRREAPTRSSKRAGRRRGSHKEQQQQQQPEGEGSAPVQPSADAEPASSHPAQPGSGTSDPAPTPVEQRSAATSAPATGKGVILERTLGELATEVDVDDPRLQSPQWRSYVVKVQTKAGTEAYYYRTALQNGTAALVAADRGYDMGIVQGCVPTSSASHQDLPGPGHPGRSLPPVVLRLATADEVTAWEAQSSDEEEAVGEAQRLVDGTADKSKRKSSGAKEAYRSLRIVGAHYQFDRRKLTLIYQTPQQYVNYRPILKPLFDKFQCRIWLQPSETGEEDSEGAGGVGPAAAG